MTGGWIGVDLDATLAEYDGWKGVEHIGVPVPAMVDRVRHWIADGREVRIFTARVYCEPTDYARVAEVGSAIAAIQKWCEAHIGCVLAITYVKDFGMIELWDDRAVQVVPNTGRRADGPDG
jgi:hypothetical protein